MLKTIVYFMLLVWSQFGLAVLAPTKITSYQVAGYDPYKVLSYGACKIDGEYHVLMTVGLAIKSRDRVNWQKYEAFKAGNVRMQGGPDLISCGKNPSFFSRDFGLYYYENNGWVKKGASFESANIFYEDYNRNIVASDSEVAGSKRISDFSGGWVDPIGGKYEGYANVLNTNDNSIYRKYVKNIGIYYDKLNGVSTKLMHLDVDVENKMLGYIELNKTFYLLLNDVDKLEGIKVVDARKNLIKTKVVGDLAGLTRLGCIGVDSVVVCKTFKHGVIFFNINGDVVNIFHLDYPKDIFDSKPNIVIGSKELLFEYGGPDETPDKELVMRGKIVEYSYSDIVRYMNLQK